jgi:hypothetical protein
MSLAPRFLPAFLLALASTPALAGGLVNPFKAFGWSPYSLQFAAQFGSAVAPAGDVNGDGFGDVLVGAYSEDNQFMDEGRTHLFLGSPTGPAPTSNRYFYPNQVGASAGLSVSSAGDVNGDGYADFLIGVPGWDTATRKNAGKVMVYHGGSNLPFNPTYELFSPTPDSLQQFGRCVAPAGDVNGDGYDDVIVSTPYYSQGGFTSRGAAWVFHGGPSGLSAVPAQTWTGPAQDGQFGAIVSPAGDVNGDGFADILVGAPLLTVAFAQGGAAYLYLGTSGGALAGPDTLIYGTEANENLGMGIGNAGDVNGDGYADVLVGSPNFGPNNEGRCRFLYGGPNGIASGFFLSNSETGPNENFGRVCATVGDLDGDGFADIGVTSRFSSGGGNGRVAVFYGSRNGVGYGGDILTPAGRISGYFGMAVAASGDTDGDGFSEILVGTDEWSVTPGFFEGRVFSYVAPRNTVRLNAGWPRVGAQALTGYGSALAFLPQTSGSSYPSLAIGDPGYNASGRVTFHPGGIFSGMSQNTNGTGLIPAAGTQGFGKRLIDVGDVNRDGYSDFVASSTTAADAPFVQAGSVDFYPGSISGLTTPGVHVLSGTHDYDQVGSALAGRGDVNGDGYQDFVVGAVEWSSASLARCGKAWLVFGTPTGPVVTEWTREGTVAGQGLGASVALTDLDGDGYSDIVVGSSVPEGVATPPAGKVEVFYGGPSGPPLDPGLVLTASPPEESYGFTVAAIGDVNADGVADLAIGAPRFNGGRGEVLIYTGSRARSQSNFPLITYQGIEAIQGFGWAIAGGGDIDGDGVGDFAIGSPGFDGGTTDMGRFDLYYGGKLLSPNPAFTFTNGINGARMGEAIAPFADGNLDGFADVAVGAPGGSGRAYAFMGGPGPGHLATLALFEPNVANKRRLHPAFLAVSDGVRSNLQYASPGGRAKIGVEFETVSHNTLFSGVPTQATGLIYDSGAPDDAAGLLSSTILAFPLINLPWPGITYRTHARFVTRSPFFPRSRWITSEAHTSGDFDVQSSGSTTGVPGASIEGARLTGVTPNPARRGTTSRIGFTITRPGRVVVDVFDVRGARVTRLLEDERSEGPSSVAWDGRDDAGRATAPGLYFAVLSAEGKTWQARLVRLP